MTRAENIGFTYMPVITIERNLSLDDLDRYYRRLEEYRSVDAALDLLLPRTLHNNYMGLAVALVQFVISWIRYAHAGKLLIDISNPETENWEEIFQEEHIFPIIALSVNNAGVYDRTGQISLTPYIRQAYAKTRDAMVKVKPLKGGKLSLTSADHFPQSAGSLPCFERQEGYIDNESTVGRNLRPAIEFVLNLSPHIQNQFRAVEPHLIAIINELMKNTYEWGKTDSHNVPVDPGVRGLLMKFYRRVRDKAVEEFRFHTGLREYFNNNRLRENGIHELYFLEISVYDSGVGFVEKYSERGIREMSDVDVIKRCLIKHRTSAAGLEKDDKGIGLDRILQLLNTRGFLRIKTNRSCLYRNLITHPYRAAATEDDMELFDWQTHSSVRFTALPNVAGSVVTIIYPLAIND